MGPVRNAFAFACVAAAGLPADLAMAQDLPEAARALLIETPAGWKRQEAWWDEATQQLTLVFRAADDASDHVAVTIRKLVDAGAGERHEFWRVPVTWKERARDTIDGQAFLHGVTDQQMGLDHRAASGVAWHTREWSVLVTWDPGRGGPAGDRTDRRSLRAWLRARSRGEAGERPTDLVRALLARFASTLAEDANVDRSQWARAEFRLFWAQFGERLRGEEATEEIVPPGLFPFGIAFLTRLFAPSLDREQRLAAYAKMTPWANGLEQQEFVWDRDRGAFLLSPQRVQQAPRCEVSVPAPAAVPAPTECLLWERSLPLRIGGRVSWPPLWQAGIDAVGAGRVFAIEAEYGVVAEGARLTLRKFDLASGELLASKELPFCRVSVLRWAGQQLCLLGEVPPEVNDRAATIAVQDLELVMNAGGEIARAVLDPDRRHEMAVAYLLRSPAGRVDRVTVGQTADFACAVDSGEQRRGTVYAMAKEEQRALWQVPSRVGGLIVEDRGLVIVEVPGKRRLVPGWTGIEVASGRVVWTLALADAEMRLAGCVGGRLLFVGDHTAVIVDAQNGAVVASVEVPQDTLRRNRNAPITDCVWVGAGGFLIVGNGADGGGSAKEKAVRFYRWP